MKWHTAVSKCEDRIVALLAMSGEMSEQEIKETLREIKCRTSLGERPVVHFCLRSLRERGIIEAVIPKQRPPWKNIKLRLKT